jgi:hypothetical protein
VERNAWGGNLGAPDVVHGKDLPRGGFSKGLLGWDGTNLQTGCPGQARGELACARADPILFLGPTFGDGRADFQPGRHALAPHGREVGASPERDALRRDEDVQRPSTVPPHGRDVVHVEGVQVGSFLTIHLYANQELVHGAGSLTILEGFVFHHVAPMAGRVPDGNQHGDIAPGGFGEGLVTPWSPIHGVVGVLEKVGGKFASQEIGGGH